MQYFTERFEVCTIDLTLNLLLLCVVLNGVITRSSESVDSSTVKLLHTNSLICDFEINPLKDLDKQLRLTGCSNFAL